VVVGRSPDADAVIDHDDVSRQHTLIWREKGRVWVRDLSSANGTFVDDVRAGSHPLPVEHGSVIGFSAHRYRFLEV
jgi:pSer/pThr/pTyr-binding forkhead associated (FHA) protein